MQGMMHSDWPQQQSGPHAAAYFNCNFVPRLSSRCGAAPCCNLSTAIPNVLHALIAGSCPAAGPSEHPFATSTPPSVECVDWHTLKRACEDRDRHKEGFKTISGKHII